MKKSMFWFIIFVINIIYCYCISMKKALLIGINYENDENQKLAGCINDAVTMKNMLIDAYGYTQTGVTVLRDDVHDENVLPTTVNIMNEFNKLVDESRYLSEIWIHYSGHGSYVEDKNKDESDGYDEVILPIDYKKNGAISDDILRSYLNRMKCVVYITMDCCHSGTIMDLPYKFPIINNRVYRNKANMVQMTNKNVYMLAGSRDNQVANDYYNYESNTAMGLFSMSLMEVLRNRNHNVSFFQLYLDINKYMKQFNMPQTAVMSSSNHYPLQIKLQRVGIEQNVAYVNPTLSNQTRYKYKKRGKFLFT